MSVWRTSGRAFAIGAAVFTAALVAFSTSAASPNDGFNDGIDRSAPDFVRASLMVASPGDEIFSCVGHAWIRLECPTFKLDNCFSYESEPVSDRVLRFFAGKLKMGMFAVPTEEFLSEYRRSGRGVRQYPLNLSPAAKQRLWQVMDAKVAEGPYLPYDYIRRGCARSALDCIKAALEPVELVSDIPKITPREALFAELETSHPWDLFVIVSVGGTEGDAFAEVVTPQNLLHYLRHAKVDGVALITDGGSEIAPPVVRTQTGRFTPLFAALLLLAVAIVNFWLKTPVLDWLLLGLQSCAGILILYLMTASELPTTCWNWLIVPLNPLPLVFWKWRRHWALGYAVLIAVWIAFVALYPHPLADRACLVVAAAFVVFNLKMSNLKQVKE